MKRKKKLERICALFLTLAILLVEFACNRQFAEKQLFLPASPHGGKAGTQPNISTTPVMEAVDEMTWGVNLADLFHADSDQTQGSTKGYYETSPFDLYAFFWNGDNITLARGIGDVKGTPIELSMKFPTYNPSASQLDWVNFLHIGMVDFCGGQTIKFRFQNSRIELADGTKEYLEDLDGEYDASTNDFFWQLEGKTPDSKYDGATFITEFVLIEAGGKQAKADAFYQMGRTKYDAEKMTDTYMEYGMNVFRLPVTWTPFVDENNEYHIDEEWLAAVKKQVDYILSKDAYCILNMYTDYLETSYVDGHWESDWMDDEYKQGVDERFAAIWSQIAEYFKDYDNHLIFETCNEPAMLWKDEEGYYDRQAQRVNELNSIFINSVRKTGGNNETRFLCLAVANYNKYGQLANLTVPDDTNLMVQLHCYDEMEERNWDTLDSNITGYETRIQNMLSAVATFKEAHPLVPVIAGETGISYLHDEAECTEAVKYFFEKTKEAGIPCLWWEDYFTLNENADFYDKGGCCWLYDKSKGEWGRPDILAAAMEGLGITKEDYFTVSYDTSGHGDQPDSVRVKSGDKITAPKMSLVEGYTFEGWYKDAEYNLAWDFEKDRVTMDIKLYAKWMGANATTEEPGNTTEEPGNTTEEPGNTTEEPGNTKEETKLTPEQQKQATVLMKKLGLSKEKAAEVLLFAVENKISMETLLVNKKAITALKGDSDIKGSSFAKMQARADKVTNNTVKLKWNKVSGADGYEIYGNKCGGKNKHIATIKKAGTVTYTQKKLKKGTNYKYIVIAYKNVGKSKITIAVCKTVHATTTGGKYGVVKSVKVNKSNVTIKKKKTFKIKAYEIKKGKKIKRHREICYESGNSKIATVSKKGVIKGISKGSCYIYVYAQNGVYKKIKVKVK